MLLTRTPPTISCNLDFTAFPFDSHTCPLNFKNWVEGLWRVSFNSPKLLRHDQNGNETGGEIIEVNKGGLEYNFIFKALPSSFYHDDPVEHSVAQVEINFKRTQKSRRKIFSGYHAQTVIFSLLSLVSYFSPPDSPIDRMGMLIVLYLIQMNNYDSVEAPSKRGFSSIEIWFIGIQIPTLVAILEYGTILAMKKFSPHQDENVLKRTDLGTFILSAFYLIIFNCIYWFF